MRTAVVIGSTGLIGQILVEKLAHQGAWSQVLAISRKPKTWSHPKIRTLVFDFENWSDLELQVSSFKGASPMDAFCCLGTTIKQAGSEQAFQKVDLEAVVSFAELTNACQAENLFVVSALGADPNSNVFYNKIKGQMEQAVLKKASSAVYFARPSLLLGDRKDFRFFERVAILLAPLYSPFLAGRLAAYRPIQARYVADAFVLIAAKIKKASQFIENADLHALTEKK